mmetsp:Transcript_30652/g.44562  ORF Transcript_30652/g.44562 Transcript_30652/m.44562 type:complete len:442 (-) Transcript_30652:292-1617(-)
MSDTSSEIRPTEVVVLDPPEDVSDDAIVQPQQPPDLSHEADDHSGEMDREYTGFFEGPEKTLEVCFRAIDAGNDVCIPPPPQPPGRTLGLRRLSRTDLDRVCRRARCTILSSISNQYLDAYVLSESSLFVYPYMIVLKTCGTTTLLRCVATLIELARGLGLEVDWLGYSRKNFNFPCDQIFPHGSFHQELEYLYSHRNLCERLDGNGYTLGPVTSDHWFVFVADQTIRSKNTELDTDRVLNIMMFDIDPTVADLFYYDRYEAKAHPEESEDDAVHRISTAQTKAAGIDSLCAGYKIDPRAFEPCGYSMNAILFRSYSTIHITPEEGSSYASFETNQKVESYSSLINNVVRTFKPKRFVMTLMADELGLQQMKTNPLTGSSESSKIIVGTGKTDSSNKMQYKRRSLASIKVEEDCCCMMGNWVLEEGPLDVRAGKLRGMSVS